MGNLGRLVPRFIEVGELPARLGRYQIAPAGQTQLPLRYIQYGTEKGQVFFAWQTIKREGLEVAPDSVLRIDGNMLKTILLPGDGRPGALLVLKEQLTDELIETVRPIGEELSPDFNSICRWLVLCSNIIDDQGVAVTGFQLSAEDLGAEEVEAVTKYLRQEIAGLMKEQGGKIFCLAIG
jgi:hypothetical protein